MWKYSKNQHIFFLLIASFFVMSCNSSQTSSEVVIYTALDQIYSEPILQEFARNTGIQVKAVYDIEATKTAGLVNRLIAEKSNPQCDVFWNNEVGRTISLKRKGVLAKYVSPSATEIPSQFADKDGLWTGFAARARVLVVNTNKMDQDDYPKSILDLSSPKWKGEMAIANPLFGTTATHVAALFAALGEKEAKAYFKSLKDNEIQVVDGNSVVKDQTGSGEVFFGFTDTDDVNMGIETGLPIKAVFLDQEGLGTLLIPNTVSIIAGAPNLDNGKKLIDFLLSKEVEEKLAFSPSVQMPLRGDVKTPDNFTTIDNIKAMNVDFERVADVMDKSITFVQDLFIR